MEIIVNSRKKREPISLIFDSEVYLPNELLRSFDELIVLKKITQEVLEYLGLNTEKISGLNPGFKITKVLVDDDEYVRIKTIVKRDNIIENILR